MSRRPRGAMRRRVIIIVRDPDLSVQSAAMFDSAPRLPGLDMSVIDTARPCLALQKISLT